MDRRKRNLVWGNKEHDFSIPRSSKTQIYDFDIGSNIVAAAARIMYENHKSSSQVMSYNYNHCLIN